MFDVYMKGRETVVASFSIQAIAEEEARAIFEHYNKREVYVVDTTQSIYAPPVYRVRV